MNWGVPFLLSLLPLVVLHLAAGEEQARRGADARRERRERVRLQADHLRRASSFPFWAERAARLLKRGALAGLAGTQSRGQNPGHAAAPPHTGDVSGIGPPPAKGEAAVPIRHPWPPPGDPSDIGSGGTGHFGGPRSPPSPTGTAATPDPSSAEIGRPVGVPFSGGRPGRFLVPTPAPGGGPATNRAGVAEALARGLGTALRRLQRSEPRPGAATPFRGRRGGQGILPTSERSNLAGCQVWAVAFPTGNPAEGVEPCRAPPLRQDFSALMTGLLQDIGRQQAIEAEEGKAARHAGGGKNDESGGGSERPAGPFDATRLRRLEAGFGEGLSADLFTGSHRGTGFPVLFRGIPHIMVWDLVFFRERTVGAFLVLLPLPDEAGHAALQLTLRYWPKGGFRPAFLPMPTERRGILPPPLLHPDLVRAPVLADIERLRRQMRIWQPAGTRFEGTRVGLLAPFTGRLVRLPAAAGWWGMVTPLDPLTGHLGLLVGRFPDLPPSALDLFRGMADMAWIFVWIMVAIRAALVGTRPAGVRRQATLWLLGVTGMPVVLGIMVGVQLNGDLRSNRLEQLERDLERAMGDLETGANRLNDRIVQQCKERFHEGGFRAALRQAIANPAAREGFLRDLAAGFRRHGLPISGLRVMGRDGQAMESFAPWLRQLSIRQLQASLQDAWDLYLAGPDGGRKRPTTTLARWQQNVFAVKGAEEQPLAWQSGNRKFFLWRMIIQEKGRPFCQVAVVWSHEKLYRAYLERAVQGPGLFSGRTDLSLSVYLPQGDDLEEVGASANLVAGREDLRRVARAAVRAKMRRITEDALTVGFPSERLPGYVFLGQASLAPLRAELWREWLGIGIVTLGLFALVLAAARLLGFRLAAPVVRMTAELRRVAAGDYAARVGDDRRDELGQAGRALDRMTGWLAERQEMSRFVSSQVLDVVAAGDYRGAMAGTQREVAILISDIRSFTTLSEEHPARDIFALVNGHMEAMTRAIQAEGGMIDRFVGDAVQAVFYAAEAGTPGVGGPADRAIRAARAMRKAHLARIEARRREGLFPYEIGIGIEQGTVVAGVMGDGQARLDFTVLGEPVQAAAELEAGSKHGTATKIIVSDLVRQTVGESVPCRRLPDGHPGWELASLEEGAPPASPASPAVPLPDPAPITPARPPRLPRPDPPTFPSAHHRTSHLPSLARPSSPQPATLPAPHPPPPHLAASPFPSYGGLLPLLVLWLVPAGLLFLGAAALRQAGIRQAIGEARDQVRERLGRLEGEMRPETLAARLLAGIVIGAGHPRRGTPAGPLNPEEANRLGRALASANAKSAGAATTARPGRPSSGRFFVLSAPADIDPGSAWGTEYMPRIRPAQVRLLFQRARGDFPLSLDEVRRFATILLMMEIDPLFTPNRSYFRLSDWFYRWFQRFFVGPRGGAIGHHGFIRNALLSRGNLLPMRFCESDWLMFWLPVRRQPGAGDGGNRTAQEGPGTDRGLPRTGGTGLSARSSRDEGDPDGDGPRPEEARQGGISQATVIGSGSPGAIPAGTPPGPYSPPAGDRAAAAEGPVAGLVLAFLPGKGLAPEAGYRFLAQDLARQGFPAAIAWKAGRRRRLVRTGAFRKAGLSAQEPGDAPFTLEERAGWVVGSQVSGGLRPARVFLARDWHRHLPWSAHLGTAGILAAGGWLLLGGWTVWRLGRGERGAPASLRGLLMGTFALVVVPTLAVGFFGVERSLLERATRLRADRARDLTDLLAAVDRSQDLALTFACNLVATQLDRPEFLADLARFEKGWPPPDRPDAPPPMRSLLVACQFLGLWPRAAELVSVTGLTGGSGHDQRFLEALRWLWNRNLSARHAAAGADLPVSQRRANLVVGTQVEEFGTILRSLMPPAGLAAWMSAPRAVVSVSSSLEEPQFFSTHHLRRDGIPTWIAEVQFSQGPLLRLALEDWDRYLALAPHPGWRIGVSKRTFPGWRLVSPFVSTDWEPGPKPADPGFYRQTPTVRGEEPRTTLLCRMAAEGGRPAIVLPERRATGRLFAATPGGGPGNLLFYGSLPAAAIFDEAETQAAGQRGLLLALAVLAALLAAGVAEAFLQPLLALAAAARRLMGREFTARVPQDRDDEFGHLATAFNEMAAGVEQGRRLRRFVSDSVRVAAGNRDRAAAARAGEHREAVVLFAGLGGFKPLLHTVPPTALVADLNRFLAGAAAAVRAEGGEIDKFIGEKVLAVFHPDRFGSATAALAAALRAATRLAEDTRALPAWRDHPVGMGLVAGKVLAGILGTAEVRLEYTVLGDTVNLAARLCDLALREGGGLAVEQESLARADALADPRFRRLGGIALKGKTRTVDCWLAPSLGRPAGTR
ncbi:MAG: HAMP domain-containing protein [Candidatus Riflebacteria bacterium]|nr:HAMP domain-containing protein [Candidatus Riflebacteria bacterium]